MTERLTSTEVARRLGVSKRTVHRMALDGRIPRYERLANGSLTFPRAVIDRLKKEDTP